MSFFSSCACLCWHTAKIMWSLGRFLSVERDYSVHIYLLIVYGNYSERANLCVCLVRRSLEIAAVRNKFVTWCISRVLHFPFSDTISETRKSSFAFLSIHGCVQRTFDAWIQHAKLFSKTLNWTVLMQFVRKILVTISWHQKWRQ